jgi:signal transduction histidine kinase
MRLTARRRVLLALIVSWPVMFVWVGWMALLGYSLTEYYRTSFASCGIRQGLNLPGLISGCDGVFSPGIAWVELLVMATVLAAAAVGLARWSVAPVRTMAETVERLGPASLGLRLRLDGPHDETRALADAVDAMLDRVAVGYEAQRRFAANASHELRTPLATQRALIEISLGSARTAEQLELVAQQLLATNERNERLVDAVEGQRAFAKERGVELTVEALPATVWGELPLLERLAVNLVQNAVKYNVEDGTVRVLVTPGGTLVVVNTGPVVPADQVQQLFEPFRRQSGERLDHGGGVGLGLTIARSIVAAHGGEIVARTNDGGGLTVEVQLPVIR